MGDGRMADAFEAVLFDMDGLIFDSERLCYLAYVRAAHRFGFQMHPHLYMSLCGKTEADVVVGLARAFGSDHDVASWRTYIREQKIAVRQEHGGKVGKKPGLLELLNYLQERDIPYALASSSTRAVIDTYLSAEYLVHAFPYVIDGSSVKNGKPDPEIFLKAAARIGADPARTLVLEDSHAGICAANAGGFTSGFIFDDLTNMEQVTEGFPILVKCEGPEAMRRDADFSFESLADVVEFLETGRSAAQGE